MPDLTSFEALVSVGSSRTVSLSSGSLAVLFSALELIGASYQWIGTAEDGSLTVTERDRVDDYIDTATYELMRVARVKEIGDVFARFVSSPPAGALLMNGMQRLQADYPNLMGFIPVSWKSGEYFTLPNMASRGLFGAGTVSGFYAAAGDVFGEVKHQLTIDEMPAHAHQQTNNANTPVVVNNANTGSATQATSGVAGAPNTPNMTVSAGGGVAHNNMSPGVGCYWFIQAE